MLQPPGSDPSSAAFSPDGRHLVSGHADGTVRLWDVATGKEVQPLTGPVGQVFRLDWSADCRKLLTAQAGGVRIWDVGSGKLPPLHALAANRAWLANDGRGFFWIDGHNRLRLYDPVGQSQREYQAAEVTLLSPDKRRGASIGQGAIAIIDLEQDRQIASLPGHRAGNRHATFAPDGETLVSTGHDGEVILWDLSSARPRERFQSTLGILNNLAISPDGRWLFAAGQEHKVGTWDLNMVMELPTMSESKGIGRYAAFSPTGTLAASVHDGGWVTLWDVAARKVFHEWQLPGPVHAIAFAADGRHLATANGNGTVYVLRLPPSARPPSITAAQRKTLEWALSTGAHLTIRIDGKPQTIVGPDGRLPDDFFELQCLNLNSAQVNDAEMERLRELPQLDALQLDNTSVTDKGLARLAAFPNLRVIRTLYLPPETTNAGLGHLVAFPDLAQLVLDNTKVTDAGLDRLAAQPKLRYVRLGKRVTAAAVEKLAAALPNCKIEWDGRVIEPKSPTVPPPLTPEQARQQQLDAAKALGVPVTIENSIGMKLNLIPAGKFLMGSPENEAGREQNESPPRTTVVASSFYLGTFEVSQGQFQAVMNANPSTSPMEPGRGSEHPVDSVTHAEAVEFCRRLSDAPGEQKAGRRYRLPTESEWEYACRAGSQGPSFFPQSAAKMGDHAWHAENSADRSHRIGTKSANPWGLHDMLGNVWEWSADESSATEHMIRGGGWYAVLTRCRPAARQPYPSNNRDKNLGFRVVCEIGSQQ